MNTPEVSGPVQGVSIPGEECGRCPLCRCGPTPVVVDAGAWRVRGCRVCTNAWTEPHPPPVAYEDKDFHAETDAAGCSALEKNLTLLPREWRKSLGQQVAMLGRHLPVGARVVEVGCGSGLLLSQLRKRGFRTIGVEPSRTACARARAEDLEVYEGYFPGALREVTGKRFDALVMTHVLEHISDPIATLKQVASLAAGGVLMLAQTHWRGLIPRWRGQRWYAWVPEQHFWHFTPEGLRSITAPLGFEPIETEFSSLVHSKRKERMVAALARFIPRWQDQFHLLLRIPEATRDATSRTAS